MKRVLEYCGSRFGNTRFSLSVTCSRQAVVMSSCCVLKRGTGLLLKFTAASLFFVKCFFFCCFSLHPLCWKPQRHMILRPGLQLDPLTVPALIWPHQPLVRTRSSPASTSLPPPHPPTTIPSLSLSSPAADTQLRFTTGE